MTPLELKYVVFVKFRYHLNQVVQFVIYRKENRISTYAYVSIAASVRRYLPEGIVIYRERLRLGAS